MSVVVMKNMDNSSTEEFIHEVEKYSALWNSSSDEYSNKKEKRKAWNAVILHFIADLEEKSPAEKKELATQAQKKWKGIRASYTRELLKKKAEKSGSGASERRQYMYFEILRFLETVTKPTTSSMDENKDEDVDNGMNVGTPREKEPENPSKKSEMKKIKDDDLIEVLKAKILKENQQQSDETNEDRLFLLSLVSELQKVPADRKLQVKASILNVISQAQVIQQPLQPHYSSVPVYNPTYQTQNTHQLQQTTFQDHGHNYWQMQPSTSARENDAMQCPAPTQSPTFSDTSSIIDFE